jgi:hypothetical protein
MSRPAVEPPRLAERLLERMAGPGIIGESIVGDAREEHGLLVRQLGRGRAAVVYWVNVLRIGWALRRRPGHEPGRLSLARAAAGDLIQAGRALARARLFTVVTAITLAVGMGAAIAVFTVVDAVLLRPLPYAGPDRLVSVMHAAPGIGMPLLGLSSGTYLTFRRESRRLEDIGVWSNDLVSVIGGPEPEEVAAVKLTANLLPLLGVRPARGRLFTEGDDTPGSPPVVVLSHQFWQTRLGADPLAVGRTVRIGGEPVEIIGVLPSTFVFMDIDPLLYLPMRSTPCRRCDRHRSD